MRGRLLAATAAAVLLTTGVVVGAVTGGGPAGAADRTSVASHDATVRSDKPDTAIGGVRYVTLQGGGGPTRYAYLKFTVTGVPAGSEVTSARLHLRSLSSAAGFVNVRQTSNAWRESTITWNSRPAAGPGITGGTLAPAAHNDFTVTSYVRGNGTYSFLLTSSSTTPLRIASSENGTAANRPQLIVTTATQPPTTTPPPTTTSPPTSSEPPPPTTTQPPPTTTVPPTTTEPPVTTEPPPPSADVIALGHYRNRPGEGGDWITKVRRTETQFGGFEGHWRDYEGVGTSGQLTALHQQALAEGRSVFLNWKPRTTTWAQVASGARDTVIRAAAAQFHNVCPDLPVGATRADFLLARCAVTIDHEPDNDIGPAGSGMTAADFVASFRRVAGIFHELAPEVPVVWTVMGFAGNRNLYPGLWPGAAYVDVIGNNPYIRCSGPPGNMATFIIDSSRWLRANLPGAASKPVVLTEWGADLGGVLSPCGSGGSIGTPQHRADAIDGVTARLGEIIAAGVVELDIFDARSDAFSCTDRSCVDGQAYLRLKAATEAA